MENVIVDIDKVLDEFEKSEALEESTSSKVYENRVHHPYHLLNSLDENAGLQINGSQDTYPSQKNLDFDCNLSYISSQHIDSQPQQQQSRTDFSNQMNFSDISSATCSKASDIQPVLQNQNVHSKDYEIYHKSFHIANMSQENSSRKEAIPDDKRTSESVVVTHLATLLGSKDKLDSITNGYSLKDEEDEVLCVSVDSEAVTEKDFSKSDIQIDVISSQVFQSTCGDRSLTYPDVNNSVTYQTSANCSESAKDVCEDTSDLDNQCSIISVQDKLSELSSNTKSPQKENATINYNVIIKSDSCDYSNSPKMQSNIGDSPLTHLKDSCNISNNVSETVTKEKEKDLDCESTNTFLAAEDINNDQGVSCSPTKVEQNVVSFCESDDDKDLSLAEVNEYLGDLSDVITAQDEDSGVSSQEGDINGNSLPSDTLNKDTVSEESNLKIGDEQIDETVQNNAEELSLESSKLKPLEMKSVANAKECYTAEKEKNSKSNGDVEITNPIFGIGNTGAIQAYTGARPKYEGPTNCPLPTTVSSASNSGMKNESGLHELHSDENVGQSLYDELEKEDHDVCSGNLININNGLISDCASTKENKNFEYSQIYDNDVDSKGLNELDAGCEEMDQDSLLSSSESQTSSAFPRIQRPTTLNLPSRVIAKPKLSPADVGETATEIPACEASNDEQLLIQIPSEESLPETNDVIGEENYTPSLNAINEDGQLQKIGVVKPFWVPDDEAPNCMHCNTKFTFMNRRHHCRACGKVLCSRCCNQRARLPYLQNKESRVCQQCFDILSKAIQPDKIAGLPGESPSSSSCGSSPNFSPSVQINSTVSNMPEKSNWPPNPNNPNEYCSTIPPLQQVQLSANSHPPTVMVPVGVLVKKGSKQRRIPKQVIFSDGIRPGGDLGEPDGPLKVSLPYHRPGRPVVAKTSPSSGNNSQKLPNTISPSVKKKFPHPKNRHKKFAISDEEGPLPPVLLPADYGYEEKPDMDKLLQWLQDDNARPVTFAVTRNLHILTKIIKLDCCFGGECWCFTSCGLCTVGQDEIMVILERLPDEKTVPRDTFDLFKTVYDNASKGVTVGELGHIIFPEGILGSQEHRGFLFIRHTFQCLSKLIVPSTPFLVALLIQKWEVPWAKVFPLRLMLRLGAECRYYPCPLVSVRHRKSVYFEIGQTIMSVLADLRNYQFTIPVVPGLVIHMEERKTLINIPRNRYDKIMKVLNNNNVEHVLTLGSNFSTKADSHLVCMQKDEGEYQTQAINIQNAPRRVTGASFIVFSGGLKSSSGRTAKSSIVEDGLLVQIPQDTMVGLQSALKDMRDITIECRETSAQEPEEVVILQWTRDDRKFNIGVRSPVDGRSLEGIQSLRIHTGTDYAGDHYLIRWTEVFFLELDENGNRRSEVVDPSRVAEAVSQAFCMALIPYLDQLADAELTRIGLRVTLDPERDKVEYDVGARGTPLPSMYMNALDSGLIPVIDRISGSNQDGPIALELTFHILIK